MLVSAEPRIYAPDPGLHVRCLPKHEALVTTAARYRELMQQISGELPGFVYFHCERERV